jgi:hypothetical protein
LALGAPGKLWLAGEGTAAPQLLKRMYQVTGFSQNLTAAAGSQAGEDDAVAWLLTQR